MCASAALLAVGAGPAEPRWDFIGTSNSGLRIFVDRSSVSTVGKLVRVTVRLGSPTAIIGRIVVVRQTEDHDCADRTWRQVGFEALDDAGQVVSQSPANQSPSVFL